MPKLTCKINLKYLNGQFLNDKTNNKKLSEPKQSKVNVESSRSHEKSRENYEHITNPQIKCRDRDRRYPFPKSEQNKPIPCRLSRTINDVHNNNNRKYRKDKTGDSFFKERDRSREPNRDQCMRQSVRDRVKRRQLDHCLPDRKPAPRPRSPRSRYSKERELQIPRLERYTRDTPGKTREIKNGDSRTEIIRKTNENTQRHNPQKDDKRYFTQSKTERRHFQTLNLHCQDYRKPENSHKTNCKLDQQNHTYFTTKNILQSPKHVHLDRNKQSLGIDKIKNSVLITDGSNESSFVHSQQPQQYCVPPENHQSPSSPKRISLDDRINLVLGIEKELFQPIKTVCTRNSASIAPNYDSYDYSCSEYHLYNCQLYQPDEYQTSSHTQCYPNQIKTDNNVKVLQIGNLIQVVPTEQSANLPAISAPKPVESTTRIMKIGNRLQIVSENTTAVDGTPHTTTSKTFDIFAAERKNNKEKRKQERVAKQKAKEEKRKERENRRLLKIKTKTQRKRALRLETGEGHLYISTMEAEPPLKTNDKNNLLMSWPPASSLTTVILPRFPGKSILISYGFRNKDEPTLEDSINSRTVTLTDGISVEKGCTSFSGGEKVRSLPPLTREMKRYKDIKEQQFTDDVSSEEDNLPPPSPPPGSPPPHLWPPRVKQPLNNIRNIHFM